MKFFTKFLIAFLVIENIFLQINSPVLVTGYSQYIGAIAQAQVEFEDYEVSSVNEEDKQEQARILDKIGGFFGGIVGGVVEGGKTLGRWVVHAGVLVWDTGVAAVDGAVSLYYWFKDLPLYWQLGLFAMLALGIGMTAKQAGGMLVGLTWEKFAEWRHESGIILKCPSTHSISAQESYTAKIKDYWNNERDEAIQKARDEARTKAREKTEKVLREKANKFVCSRGCTSRVGEPVVSVLDVDDQEPVRGWFGLRTTYLVTATAQGGIEVECVSKNP